MATASKTLRPSRLAFHEVGRQAIMADPHWKDGHYYGGHIPAKGLAVTRMIDHVTLSAKSRWPRNSEDGLETRNRVNLVSALK